MDRDATATRPFSDIFISPLIDKLTGTAYVGPVVQEVLVGKLGSFDIPGLLMWFNSLDHRPFHFHAKKTGKWELRIFFLECSEGLLAYEAKWSKPKGRGPSARDLRLILDQVLRHREELLKEWESKVKTEVQP